MAAPLHLSHFPTSTFQSRCFFQQRTRSVAKRIHVQCHVTTRRATTSATLAALITTLVMESTSIGKPVNALDFKITAPDQTLEQAESGIRGHARSLIQVKDLLEEGSWKAAQKTLRKSSAELKQDMYTMIQAKPGSERAELRRLYSKLFNNVTKLDYAAESDEKLVLVWECYDNVVSALNHVKITLVSLSFFKFHMNFSNQTLHSPSSLDTGPN